MENFVKKILIILAVITTLSGCVVTDPYYVHSQQVYVEPRPIYVTPPVYYRMRPDMPICYWSYRWNPHYRTNQRIGVCR